MTESLNALQDNIKRKGKNAYYYAHGDKRSEVDCPVYDSLPLRLESTADPSSSSGSEFVKPIKSYSWSDGKQSVCLYIPLDDLQDLQESDIETTCNGCVFKLRLNHQHKGCHELVLNKLHDEVTDCKVKIKREKNVLVLLLKKQDPKPWYDLQVK